MKKNKYIKNFKDEINKPLQLKIQNNMFNNLAEKLDKELPESEEKDEGLKKLLESKAWFERAFLNK